MSAELLRVTTSDSLYLEGLLLRPADDIKTQLPVDVFVLVHGTASNFYAPGVLETFSQQALELGVAVARINTRGHDAIASNPGPEGAFPGGAAYESITDCRHDLHAWLNEMSRRGFRRIVLVGHSMGGVKSIYTMAIAPHPAVSTIISISSPRFQYEVFNCYDVFKRDWQSAQEFVKNESPDELMRVLLPLPMLITAQNFLEKYGPEDAFDIIKHLPNSRCPVLAVIGTESILKSPAFSNQPEALEELISDNPHLTLQIVEGANTNYSGQWDIPFQRAADWFLQ